MSKIPRLVMKPLNTTLQLWELLLSEAVRDIAREKVRTISPSCVPRRRGWWLEVDRDVRALLKLRVTASPQGLHRRGIPEESITPAA